MSKYQELVKSFDNIRKIANNFFVYGYSGRGDFNFISDRTYDNELRHIKSYLKNYVKTTNQKDKKTISISSNTVFDNVNPLFGLFLSKSFTSLDCFLHFAIIDILADNMPKTLNEIANDIIEYYEKDDLDIMTIRNKLHEYVEIGLINIEKESNKNLYCLTNIVELDDRIVEAISFFQNILPAGYIMNQITKKELTPYIYKQIFFSQVLDDEYVLTLLKAKHEHKKVIIKQKGKNNELTVTGIPNKIYHNMVTGRRYVNLLTNKKTNFDVRIDKIESIILELTTGDVEQKLQKTDNIKLTLFITKDETFVVERIIREVGDATLKQIDDEIYELSLFACRGEDYIPYIRTFYGRIIDIESNNYYIINKMRKDLKKTLYYYEEGELDVS